MPTNYEIATYHGDLYPDQIQQKTLPEYGEPYKLIHTYEEGEGMLGSSLRVLLGTANMDDVEMPDLLIERHPKGWVVILHGAGGGDPVAAFYIHDDGRNWCKREDLGPEQTLTFCENYEGIPDFDAKETAEGTP